MQATRNVFELYVSLRSEILTVISGSPNATQGWGWDNTTPNHAIKRQLELLFSAFTSEMSRYGAHLVYRHYDCGRRSHESPEEGGFFVVDGVGNRLQYQDDEFSWHLSIWQGTRNCECPCSNKEAIKHHVLEDVIIEKKAVGCAPIPSILVRLISALECAGDKSPRSGIREQLLAAILEINDAIRPVTIEEYIEHQKLLLSPRASGNALRCSSSSYTRTLQCEH